MTKFETRIGEELLNEQQNMSADSPTMQNWCLQHAYHWVKPQVCWAKHALADLGVRWSIFYKVYILMINNDCYNAVLDTIIIFNNTTDDFSGVAYTSFC